MLGFWIWAARHCAVADLTASVNLSIFDPPSPPAGSIRDLALLVFAITALIFVDRGRGAVLLHLAVSPRPGQRRHRAAAGLRQQADRSRLDRRAGVDRFYLVLVTTRTLWEVEVHPAQAGSRTTRPCSSR